MSVFSKRRSLGLAIAACSILGLSGGATAQLSLNPEFVVNQETNGLQATSPSFHHSFNQIAELTNGTRIVSYYDQQGNDGGGEGAFISLIDANDTVFGTVNVSNSANNENPSGLAALSTGGFVATFKRTAGATDCFVRIFDNAGTETVAEFDVDFGVHQSFDCDVAALAGGDFFVTWGAVNSIYGRRFNSDGSPDGAVVEIDTSVNVDFLPVVTSLSSGGYAVAWQNGSNADGDLSGIFMRAYDASGVPATAGPVQVNTTTAGTQDGHSIAGLSDGNIAFVWFDSNTFNVNARVLSPTGTQISAEDSVHAGTPTGGTSVASLPAGGFLVAFDTTTPPAPDNSNRGVILAPYNNDGSPSGPQQLVNTTLPSDQFIARIGTFADGSFLVTYTDSGNAVDGNAWSVLARSFTGFTLEANTRVIDAFVTASSDIGGSGTDLLPSDLDFTELDVDVELEFAVVVQNTDQFDGFAQADLTVTLEGAMLSQNIGNGIFTSGGSCDMQIQSGGAEGDASFTFRTSDLSACDDEVVDRDYSNGGDDDMVFTVPVRLTSTDVNFSVEITRNGDTVLGSDTHDSDDANDVADPVSEGGDVSSVLTYGNAAVSATNPLGEGAFVNATLASDYNQLEHAADVGHLWGKFSGRVYSGGHLVDFDETAHIDTVTLTVNIADARGVASIGLWNVAQAVGIDKDVTLEADNSASVSFILDNTSTPSLIWLGTPLYIFANADTDDDTQIQRTAVTTQIDVAYVDALELTDESNTGGIDQIGREGATGEFEWVGDTTAATQNVWRLTGLGDTAPALYVTLANSTLDVDGQYGLTPANAISNGELILTQTDIQNAVGQAFGRADVTLEVEASGVTMRRFLITNGIVTEYTADYSLGANQIGD